MAGASLPSYTLTGGSLVPFANDYILNVKLSFDDVNEIKRLSGNGLATGADSTFLYLSNATVADMAGNLIVGVENRTATSYVTDTTSPRLLSFDLQMTNGTEPLEIVLRFSETIDVSIIGTMTSVTLRLTNVTNPSTDVMLSIASGTTVSTMDSPNVTLFVSGDDLNTIRSRPPLGQSVNDTFLSLSGAVRDMFFNNIEPVPIVIFSVDVNSADLVPPTLTSFTLDMNNKLLVLTFDDNIQLNTFNITEIRIQSSRTSSALSVVLDSASTLLTTQNGKVFEIEFSTATENTIKAEPLLASSINSTYLSYSPTALDIAGNEANPILTSDALQASIFTPDTTPPMLVSFELSIMDQYLILTTAAAGPLVTELVVRLYELRPVCRLMSSMTIDVVLTDSSNDNVKIPSSMSKSNSSNIGSPSSFTNILTGTKEAATLGLPSAS